MIKLHKVNKYFYRGESREIHALKNIDLEIKKGDFSALVGSSGCGKTTLLNAIGILDKIDNGEIYLEEKEIAHLNEAQSTTLRLNEIGFIFQAYNLIPVLNVAENIAFIMRLRGFKEKKIQKRVTELGKLLQIEDKLQNLPNTLSGGEQQRVAVARAVATKPKIILADEPTANLDSKNSMILMEMMKNLNTQENMTILFASHDKYVMQSVDKVIRMNDGTIVE